MSVSITYNNKTVLRVQNGIFACLHKTIVAMIEERQLVVPNITKLLEDTDQEIYGSGVVYADISEYLKSKKDLLRFADLVKQAIEREYDYFNHFEGCIDHLWNFYHELINYVNELKN